MQGNQGGFSVSMGGTSMGGPAFGAPAFQQFNQPSQYSGPFFESTPWNAPQPQSESPLDIVNKITSVGNNIDTITNLPGKIEKVGNTINNVGNTFSGVLDGTTSIGDGLSSILNFSGTGGGAGSGFTGFSGLGDTSSVGNFTSGLGDFGTGSSGAGSFLGQTSMLGKGLSGAGFGAFAGGYLGKLFGGSEMGGSIGGAIGGAIGATALGGMTGAQIGGMLGSVVPGIGTVIGTIAGSLLGSAFGGSKTPHPASMFWGGNITATGETTGSKYASKHISNDVAKSVESDFSKYLQDQAKKYGISYNDKIAVFGGSNRTYYDKTKDGTIGVSATPDFWTSEASKTQGSGQNVRIGPSYYRGGDETTKLFNFNLNDKESKQKAYEDAFKYIAQSSGIDVTKLTPQAAQGNVVLQQPRGESPFDKFLKEYREKQNANLA